ncbi:MAG TPA: hypothetical protein VFX11_16960, partial [Candidatus Kapabacteria bacterium]|nr:hypothetical protein [Candidatus Kapabacteria bacterium]
ESGGHILRLASNFYFLRFFQLLRPRPDGTGVFIFRPPSPVQAEWVRGRIPLLNEPEICAAYLSASFVKRSL